MIFTDDKITERVFNFIGASVLLFSSIRVRFPFNVYALFVSALFFYPVVQLCSKQLTAAIFNDAGICGKVIGWSFGVLVIISLDFLLMQKLREWIG
jgi:hypothetical protein